MSMDLGPADYVLRALPRSTVEFPIILFSLVGIIGSVVAYATIFSEDGEDITEGIDFNNFGIADLGFTDPPRSDESSSNGDTSGAYRDDSYGFGFGESDTKENDKSFFRGGRKSKKRARSGGCSASYRRKKNA